MVCFSSPKKKKWIKKDNMASRVDQKKKTRIRKLVPSNSPRNYIDWYTRVVQYNKVGLIDETKNRKSMGLYRRPKNSLILMSNGSIEETKNKVGIIE